MTESTELATTALTEGVEVCPDCYADDTLDISIGEGIPTAPMLNVRRDHFFVCHRHRCYWAFASNLLSGWHHETEEIWQRNAETLEKYRRVEPVSLPRPGLLPAIGRDDLPF
jgi:hypothetical protein